MDCRWEIAFGIGIHWVIAGKSPKISDRCPHPDPLEWEVRSPVVFLHQNCVEETNDLD